MSSKALIAGLAALVVVAGIAIAVTQIVFRPSNDEAIGLVPEDAEFYMNVFMRPSNGQKRAIEDLLATGEVSADEATDRIAEVVDRALRDVGLTFEDDIDPALGNQFALFARDLGSALGSSAPSAAPLTSEGPDSVDAALLVHVANEDKARELIDVATREGDAEVTGTKTYEGYEYAIYDDESAVGFVGDFAIVGTEAGFRSVVDTAEGGDSLEESDAYQDVTGRLHEDNLAVFYFNTATLVEDARAAGGLTAEDEAMFEVFGDTFERPFASIVYAESEGIVVENASPIPTEGPLAGMAELLDPEAKLADLPRDAWLALEVPRLGRLAELFFDLGNQLDDTSEVQIAELERGFEAATGLNLRKHVFEGIGDVRAFVSGGIGPGTRGGIVVDVTDEDVALDIVAALRGFAEDEGVPLGNLELDGYDQGFSITDPAIPEPVHVVVDGTRIVAGFGADATRATLEGDDLLAGSDKFQTATELLGDDYEPLFYLDLDPPLAAFGNFVAPQIPDYPAGTLDPILDAASQLTVGVARDEGYLLQKYVVGFEQG